MRLVVVRRQVVIPVGKSSRMTQAVLPITVSIVQKTFVPGQSSDTRGQAKGRARSGKHVDNATREK